MIYVKTMARVSALLLSLATLGAPGPAVAQSAPQGQAQQNLPAVKLQVGMHLIHAQVASAPMERQTGLMYRREMPPNEGMLFVFEAPSPQCFWMRNTLLPLSIAFLADDGTVVNLDDMKPQTDDSHCSARPVRYVLEMNQGWFAKRGIQAGARITGGPFGK